MIPLYGILRSPSPSLLHEASTDAPRIEERPVETESSPPPPPPESTYHLASTEEMLQASLLRQEEEENLPLTPSTLKILFNIQDTSPIEKAKNWLRYLFSLAPWEKTKVLEEALSFQENLLNLIQEKDLQQTKQALKSLSQETFEGLSHLKKGERVVFIGGTPFKPPQFSIDARTSFGTFYTRLTNKGAGEEVLKKWISSIKTCLEDCIPRADNQKNLAAILEKGLLSLLLPSLSTSLFEGKNIFQKVLLSPLELGRKIVEELGLEYQEAWETPARKFAKEWIDEGAREEILNALKEGNLSPLLEKKLLSWAVDNHTLLRETFFKTVQNLSSNLPPTLRLLLQLSGYGYLGAPEAQILLEIIKEEGETFHLKIFAAKEALEWHPSDVQNEKRLFMLPLEYRSVALNDLDASFFFRFFSYPILPLKDEALSYSISKFYEDLLGSLSQKPCRKGTMIPMDKYESAMEAFIHTSFFSDKSPKEESRFYFDLRLKALIYAFREEFEPALLKQATLLLNKEMACLITEGHLSLKEAQQAYATTWEILEALKAKEPPAQKKERLLPQQMREQLQHLLQTEDREFIEEVLCHACGNDIKEILDELRPEKEEIISISPKAFPWKAMILDFSGQFFGLSTRDISRPNTLSYVKITLLVVRLSLTVFFPAMGLTLNLRWMVSIIAKRALSEIGHFFFSPLMKKLLFYERRFYLKLLMPLVLNAERRAYLETFLKEWKGTLFRTTPLSYTVQHSIAPSSRIQVKLQERISFFRSIPKIEPPKYPLMLLNPHDYSLSPQEFYNSLQEADDKVCILGIIGNSDSFIFLNDLLRRLPSPSQDKTHFWHQVQDPGGCLRLLANLTLKLLQSRPQDISKEYAARHIILNFKLYAITDLLARRLPDSHLDSFTPNGWALKRWADSLSYRVIDLQIHEQLQDILVYFGIDPKRPYSLTEIEKHARSRHTLFFQNENITNPDEYCAEHDYYQTLLKDPLILEKLEKRQITSESAEIVKLSALYEDKPLQQERLLPKGFFYFRILNGIAHGLINPSVKPYEIFAFPTVEEFTIQFEGYQSLLAKGLHTLTLGLAGTKEKLKQDSAWLNRWKAYGQTINPFTKFTHNYSQDFNTIHKNQPEQITYNSLANSPSTDFSIVTATVSSPTPLPHSVILGSFVSLNPRTQEEIIQEPASFAVKRRPPHWTNAFFGWARSGTKTETILSQLSEKERAQLEMVFTDPERRAGRTLSYFSQNIHLLKKPGFIELFSWLLLQGESLSSTLISDPKFGKVLGDFFSQALSLLGPDKEVVELLILVRAHVRQIAPSFVVYFPNYSVPHAYLRALPYLLLDPQDATKEEKEVAIQTLCNIPYLFYLKNENQAIALEAYEKWKSTIAKTLDENPSLRSHILNKAADTESQKNEWIGKFPVYHSGHLICDFTHIQTRGLITQQENVFQAQVQALLLQIYGPGMPKQTLWSEFYDCIHFHSLKFYLCNKDGDPIIAAERLFEGKRYTWIEPLNEDLAEQEIPLSYWLEKNPSSDQAQVLCFEGDTLIKKFTVHKSANEESIVESLNLANPLLLSTTTHSLSALSWFQPLSSIEITLHPETREIQTLTFQKLCLAFHRKEEELFGTGPLSTFYIARNQNKPLDFSSFLLLENGQRQEKIIVPYKFLGATLFSKLLEKFFAIKTSHAIDSGLTNLMGEIDDPVHAMRLSPFFIYDIDKEGNPTAKEPLALFYLIIHFVLEDKPDEALYNVRLLESLFKQRPLDPLLNPLITALQLLNIAIKDPLLRQISLRLCASLKENEAIFLPGKKQKSVIPEPLPFLILMNAYKAYLEQKKDYLNEYQELTLLHSLASNGDLFLKQSKLLDNPLFSPLKDILISASEMLIMQASVYDRYLMLMQKHSLHPEGEKSLLKAFTYHYFFKQNQGGQGTVSSLLLKLKETDPSLDPQKMSNILFLLNSPQTDEIPTSFLEISEEDIQTHFLTYYSLAKGDPMPSQKALLPPFRRALTLMYPGDFSEETKNLVAGLKLVYQEGGIGYPSSTTLREILENQKTATSKTEQDQLLELLEEWIDKYNLRLTTSLTLKFSQANSVLTLAKTWARANIKEIATSILINQVGGAPLISAYWTGRTLLKAYQSLSPLQREENPLAPLASLHQINSLSTTDLRVLQRQDSAIDTWLQELIHPFILPTERETAFFDLPYPQNPKPLEACAFDHLRNSALAAKNLEKNLCLNIHPKDIPLLQEKLGEIQERLQDELTSLKEEIVILLKKPLFPTSRDSLTFLLRRPPFDKSHLPFEEILYLFGEGKLSSLKEKLNMKETDISRVEIKLFSYLVLASRLKQLEKCAGLLAQGKEEIDKGLLSQISQELTKKRAYHFDTEDLPESLKRALVLLEYSRGLLLWKNQLEQLKKLLSQSNLRALLQLPTGSGKTDIFAPLINHVHTGIYTIFPGSLVSENMQQMSQVSLAVFRKTIRYIPVSRYTPPDAQSLWMLRLAFEQSVKGDVSAVGKKEDAQALELLFIETLAKAQGKEASTLVPLYKQLLKFIRTHMRANIDEGHELFRIDKELNYPQGAPQRLKQEYIDILSLGVYFIVKTPGEFHAKIPGLIQFYKKHLRIPEQIQASFTSYLQDLSFAVPEWLHNHPQSQEIALIRGLIHVLLPECLNKKINIDFGLSKRTNNPPTYAIPYAGNNAPLEEATIKDPFEAVLKTLLTYLHTKISEKQTERFVEKLRLLARKESEQSLKPEEDTKTASCFSLWVKGKFELFSPHIPISQVSIALSESPAALLSYVRLFVLPDITCYESNLRSDSQNFASLFHSFYSTSASPPLEASLLPDHTSILWNAGTEGAFAEHLCRTTPPSSIFSLTENEPIKVLEETSLVMAKNKNLFALIDSGALFQGISNQKVAESLLACVKQSRRKIKGVVFFDENNTLKVIQETSQLCDYSACPLKPEELLTYFDEIHIFGANIPQPFSSQALCLLSTNSSFSRLMQSVGRMRKFMEPEGQTVLFALSHSMPKLTSAKELILYAQKTSIDLHAKDYLPSLKQKMDNIIRRAILDKILFARSLQETLKIFKEFEDLLIDKTAFDPFKLYAIVPQEINPEKALEYLKARAFGKISSSYSFSDKEKEAIQRELDLLGKNSPSPQTVLLAAPNTPTLGVAQQLFQTREQQNTQELQQEEQTHIQLQLHTEAQVEKEKLDCYLRDTPATWDHLLSNPHLLKDVSSWLRMFPPPQGSESHDTARIYSMEATMKAYPAFQDVAKAFKGLFVTNNFRGILSDSTLSPLFHKTQKPILELLVIQDRTQNKYCTIAIDQSEAMKWKEILKANRLKEMALSGSFRIGIIDLKLKAVIDTGFEPLLESEISKSEQFMYDMTRWRFLAGHVNYEKEVPILKRWIELQNPEKMLQVFEAAYKHQGTAPLDDSDIAYIFQKKLDCGEEIL